MLYETAGWIVSAGLSGAGTGRLHRPGGRRQRQLIAWWTCREEAGPRRGWTGGTWHGRPSARSCYGGPGRGTLVHFDTRSRKGQSASSASRATLTLHDIARDGRPLGRETCGENSWLSGRRKERARTLLARLVADRRLSRTGRRFSSPSRAREAARGTRCTCAGRTVHRRCAWGRDPGRIFRRTASGPSRSFTLPLTRRSCSTRPARARTEAPFERRALGF